MNRWRPPITDQEAEDAIRRAFGANAEDVIAQAHLVARESGRPFAAVASMLVDAGPASLGGFTDRFTAPPRRRTWS